jgi:hypothetical protein
MTTSSAITINSEKVTVEENTQDESLQTQTITLIRFGPDGSETPIEIDIELDDEKDPTETIIEKCNELLENDIEMQSFFNSEENDSNDSGLTLNCFSKVTSRGRGFHFKTKLRLRFILIKKLLSLCLPKINVHLFRKWIICNYRNDTKAKTEITPRLSNVTKTVNGSHLLIMRHFVGFALWPGRFEKSPFDILPRLVVGRARIVLTYK